MSTLNGTDALGYLAASLVLAAFCMRDMTALRLVALASNLAFMAYAALADLPPILWLHAVLLPVNVWRLLHLRAAAAPQNETREAHGVVAARRRCAERRRPPSERPEPGRPGGRAYIGAGVGSGPGGPPGGVSIGATGSGGGPDGTVAVVISSGPGGLARR